MVESIGGEVIVQGMLLRERLAFMERSSLKDADQIGLTYELMCDLVLADDDQPVFTAAEWELFSTAHEKDFFAVLKVLQALNGFDAEVVKKS